MTTSFIDEYSFREIIQHPDRLLDILSKMGKETNGMFYKDNPQEPIYT